MNTNEILKAAAAKQATPTLVAAMLTLDAQPKLDPAERAALAAICDAITDRHPGSIAAIDRMIDDEAYFETTYAELVILALAETAA